MSADDPLQKVFTLPKKGNRYVIPPELQAIATSNWIVTRNTKDVVAYEAGFWREVEERIVRTQDKDIRTAALRYMVAPKVEVDFRYSYLHLPYTVREWLGHPPCLNLVLEGQEMILGPIVRKD